MVNVIFILYNQKMILKLALEIKIKVKGFIIIIVLRDQNAQEKGNIIEI